MKSKLRIIGEVGIISMVSKNLALGKMGQSLLYAFNVNTSLSMARHNYSFLNLLITSFSILENEGLKIKMKALEDSNLILKNLKEEGQKEVERLRTAVEDLKVTPACYRTFFRGLQNTSSSKVSDL